MAKNNYFILIVTLIIGISIMISGYLIGNAIKGETSTGSLNVDKSASVNDSVECAIWDLAQTAEYLKMTEEDVRGIIQTEKSVLDLSGMFTGKMFPYFTVNNKQYFYKNEIDEWLNEVSGDHREYNTKDKWILQ